MSTLTATLALLALYAGVLAPLAFALLKPKATIPVLSCSGVLLLGILFYHANPFARPAVDPAALVLPDMATQMTDRCQQILTAVDEGGVILDRSDPLRPVVSREVWRHVPDNIRQAIGSCLEELRPVEAERAAIEFIER